MIDIPEGWVKRTGGAVRKGNQLWCPSTKQWVMVDEKVWSGLAFLAAIEVDELICVIERINR